MKTQRFALSFVAAATLWVGGAATVHAVAPVDAPAVPGILGTVLTDAVTAPVTVGGVTYLPCGGCGGGAGTVPIGTIVSTSVEEPVTVGGILYVPATEPCYFCGPRPW